MEPLFLLVMSKIGGAKRANNCKITPEHTEFLAELVDKNPCITVETAREGLCTLFDGFSISGSGLRNHHMKEKNCLALKDSHIYTMERDTKRTLEPRFSVVGAWKAASMDFQTNHVFMDEAGFNRQQIRSKVWSIKSTPAIAHVRLLQAGNAKLLTSL